MIGYTDYEHADWLAGTARAHQEAAARRAAERESGTARGRPRKPPTLGMETLPLPLSDFHARVAHIIGITFGGIYNAPVLWDRVDWKFGHGVSVPIRSSSSLATWYFNKLTLFVFLCHAARIRGEVEPNGTHGLRLVMWQRKDHGRMGEFHPALSEAVAMFEKAVPATHPVRYRAPAPELATEAAA